MGAKVQSKVQRSRHSTEVVKMMWCRGAGAEHVQISCRSAAEVQVYQSRCRAQQVQSTGAEHRCKAGAEHRCRA